MFRQLAFASEVRAGVGAAETSAVIGALRASHARDSVTGVLLYSGHSFLQLIEGSEAAIAASWRALLADGRHRNPVVLYEAMTPTRWYSDWRAGYVPESTLGPSLARWRALAPPLPPHELEQLRMLLSQTKTF